MAFVASIYRSRPKRHRSVTPALPFKSPFASSSASSPRSSSHGIRSWRGEERAGEDAAGASVLPRGRKPPGAGRTGRGIRPAGRRRAPRRCVSRHQLGRYEEKKLGLRALSFLICVFCLMCGFWLIYCMLLWNFRQRLHICRNYGRDQLASYLGWFLLKG